MPSTRVKEAEPAYEGLLSAVAAKASAYGAALRVWDKGVNQKQVVARHPDDFFVFIVRGTVTICEPPFKHSAYVSREEVVTQGVQALPPEATGTYVLVSAKMVDDCWRYVVSQDGHESLLPERFTQFLAAQEASIGDRVYFKNGDIVTVRPELWGWSGESLPNFEPPILVPKTVEWRLTNEGWRWRVREAVR